MKPLSNALFLASSLFLVGGTADAARLTSGKKLEVKVDPAQSSKEKDALWKQFGGWCAIAEWNPGVKACTETREGSDRFRTLTLKDGALIKEKLLDQSSRSYRYSIVEGPLPVRNYEAQFTVVAGDENKDEVDIVWTATYEAANGKDENRVHSIIDGILRDGIAGIKAKLGESGKKANCSRYVPSVGMTVSVPCDE